MALVVKLSLVLTFLGLRVSGFKLSITGKSTNCVPAHVAHVVFSPDAQSSFSRCLCDSSAQGCELSFSLVTAFNRNYTALLTNINISMVSELDNRHIFSCVVLNLHLAELNLASIKCKRQNKQNYSCIGGDQCSFDNEMCSTIRFPNQFCDGVRDILLIWESFQAVTIEQGPSGESDGIKGIQRKQVKCHDSCVISSTVLAQIDEDESKQNTALILGLIFGILTVIVLISVGMILLVDFIRARKNSSSNSDMNPRHQVPRIQVTPSTPTQVNSDNNVRHPGIASGERSDNIMRVGPNEDTQDRDSSNIYAVIGENDMFQPTTLGNYNNVPSFSNSSNTSNNELEDSEGRISEANNYALCKGRQERGNIRNASDEMPQSEGGPDFQKSNSEFIPAATSDRPNSDSFGYSLAQPMY